MKILLFCILNFFIFCNAESAPRQKQKSNESVVDQRFRTVNYSTDIVKLSAKIGRFLEIEFDPSETDIKYAIGDKEGWVIKVATHSFYLKPKAKFADTNLKITTNKRVYWFDIAMEESKTKSTWHIGFNYPPEPPPIAIVPMIDPKIIAAANLKTETVTIEEKLGKNPSKEIISIKRVINSNYSVIGPLDITPTSIADNGEHTVLTFHSAGPMPAVFVVEPDGNERRVGFHLEDDMLIVHLVAQRLVLKRGSSVAAITNESYAPTGPNTTTHTISDEVQREIKGQE
ncbi:Type IV secretion system protein virB9 (plasmid) [Janthinobacterium sp. HH102]|uniref:TrbG/VirB9 family P-type conjugative transfer protein n=1 Tax=Janthinobacterium sp. HH102 TaxID=1537274 RepID=UPI000892C7D5|nr:TrbG/VirB9 family P-type conjugative transfer protein [Janthinobacterium sp. HH102]QOU76437.1 Type IV secretion system protein virB9 [Janthinobacterium sp. HH102]